MSLQVVLSTSFWLYEGTLKEAPHLGRCGIDDSRPIRQVEFLLLHGGEGLFCIETFLTDMHKWRESLFWAVRLGKNKPQHVFGTSSLEEE